MKLLRKILLYFFGLLIFLIATLAVLGYVFEDKLHVLALRELGKVLNADIGIEETNVSFLRHFPKVSVELEGLSLNPVGGLEESSTFIHIGEAAFSLDLWSFMQGEYKIRGLHLSSPDVRLIKDVAGNWNYRDIFRKPGEASPPDKRVMLELKEVTIAHGRFGYFDLGKDVVLSTNAIDIKLDGEFMKKSFELEGKVALTLGRYAIGGKTWLAEKQVSSDLILNIDLENQPTYGFKEAKIKIAGLELDLGGQMIDTGDWLDLDFNFATNQNSFESVLSLFPPGVLNVGGAEYDYSGDFVLNGTVKGPWGPKKDPVIHADFEVKKGTFQYKGYKAKLTGINLDGKFDYNPKAANGADLILKTFAAKLGDHGLSGHLDYKGFKDPWLDFELIGEVDLVDLQEFYPRFADSTELRGMVTLNVKGNGKKADYLAGNYKTLQNEGKLNLDGLFIKDRRLRNPIENLTGRLVLDHHQIEITSLDGKSASSDFKVRGRVKEYLSYLLEPDGILSADLEFRSNHLSLNDFFRKTEKEKESSTKGDEFIFSLPKRIDLNLTAEVGQFEIEDMKFAGLAGKMRLNRQSADLQGLKFKAFGGDAFVKGKVTFENPNRALLNLALNWEEMDINQTFRTMGQWGQFTLVEDHIFGTFAGNVNLNGYIDERLNFDSKTLKADGHVDVYEGELKDFEPLRKLSLFVKMDKLMDVKFEDIHTDWHIADGYFSVPLMRVKAHQYEMEVEGRHSFANVLDYRLRVTIPKIWAKESKESKVSEWVEEAPVTELKVVLPIKITGTVDDPKFKLDGQFVKKSIEKGLQEEKKELAIAARTETEDIFGAQDTTNVEDWIEEEGDKPKKLVDINKWVQKLKKKK